MSYVSIFAVRKTGVVERIGEARNNHGYAPQVWEHLGKKYKCIDPNAPYYGADEDGLKKLWKLFKPEGTKNEVLDALDNILLGSTFDRVWIKKERLPLLFEAIQRFTTDHVRPMKRVETALECIPVIKKAMEEDPELVGVCFNQCSANSDYWYKNIPMGEDGEPLVGNGQPYDWDREPLNIFTDKNNGREEDGEHWEIGATE